MTTRRWHVRLLRSVGPMLAEWNLVFSFRSVEPEQRTLWVTYPLSSASKAPSSAQAERLSSDTLAAFLAEHLA